MICPMMSGVSGERGFVERRCMRDRCMWYVTLTTEDFRGGRSQSKACAVAFSAVHDGSGMNWGLNSAEPTE